MFTIPFSDSIYSAFTQQVTLDDTDFNLKFYWNDRFKYWSMSIADFEDNIIVEGIKLVLNFDLIQPYRHLSVPEGQLYVLDSSDTLLRIERYDIDKNVNLFYVEESDFAII